MAYAQIYSGRKYDCLNRVEFQGHFSKLYIFIFIQQFDHLYSFRNFQNCIFSSLIIELLYFTHQIGIFQSLNKMTWQGVEPNSVDWKSKCLSVKPQSFIFYITHQTGIFPKYEKMTWRGVEPDSVKW